MDKTRLDAILNERDTDFEKFKANAHEYFEEVLEELKTRPKGDLTQLDLVKEAPQVKAPLEGVETRKVIEIESPAEKPKRPKKVK